MKLVICSVCYSLWLSNETYTKLFLTKKISVLLNSYHPLEWQNMKIRCEMTVGIISKMSNQSIINWNFIKLLYLSQLHMYFWYCFSISFDLYLKITIQHRNRVLCFTRISSIVFPMTSFNSLKIYIHDFGTCFFFCF